MANNTHRFASATFHTYNRRRPDKRPQQISCVYQPWGYVRPMARL